MNAPDQLALQLGASPGSQVVEGEPRCSAGRRGYTPPLDREAARRLGRPEPGYWLVRLTRGGPRVPVAIERIETTAEPDCPENDMTGTRSPFLAAFICGEPAGVPEVWERRGHPIGREEYLYQIADAQHARDWRPGDPKANPRQPVDLASAPPIYQRGA